MPPKKKNANGYKMPDPLPKGEIIADIFKKQWKLGKSIGKGGFGEIYETLDASSGGNNYPYVMKIEPHQNGPLFVEMNFYLRVAKKEFIAEFMKTSNIKRLGMPPYISSGSHEYKGEKYRFLVMEKYGKDIWKCYLENDKKFPDLTVYKIGIQVLDVLEYIHSKDYIHADIKGANILLGLGKGSENQVYVVDFGLATKFTTASEYKPDPKRAHDGTIEYLSRDAHKGVPTRRGDLEILFYNLIHWMGCKLPWEKCLTDPKAVEQSKIKEMEGSILSSCFSRQTPPKALVNYYDYLKKMEFNEKPDYKKVRGFLLAALKESGGNENSPLQFTKVKTPAKRKSDVKENEPAKKQKQDGESVSKTKGRGRKPKEADENGEKMNTPKKRGRKPKAKAEPIIEDENTPLNGNEDDSDSGMSTVSETAEMIRLRKKIAAKKQPKKTATPRKAKATNAEKTPSTPTREKLHRNAKPKTYKDGSFLDDLNEYISSNSESDTPVKKMTKGSARI